MKTYQANIIGSVKRLIDKMKKNDDDLVEKILLFNDILKRLPCTTMVDKEYLHTGELYRGTTELFPQAYWGYLSPSEKSKLTIAFAFSVEDKAKLTESWFDGQVIFEGNWIETLKTMLEMMSLTEIGLTEKENNALKAFSEAIK
ncbi:MAG: hypothetical protein ACM3PZ_00470 [Bacillota bacterium]